MKTDKTELRDKLAELVGQLRFSESEADIRRNEFWGVYVTPWNQPATQSFDALLHVQPASDNVESAQGFHVAVRAESSATSHSGTTNKRGQVWFRKLPAGGYRAQLESAIAEATESGNKPHSQEAPVLTLRDSTHARRVTVPLALVTLLGPRPRRSSLQPRGSAAPVAPQEITSLAASSASVAPRIVGVLRRIPVQRVALAAHVKESADGAFWLFISTEDASLAQAEVQFRYGEMHGRLTLAPVSGGWEGHAQLASLPPEDAELSLTVQPFTNE